MKRIIVLIVGLLVLFPRPEAGAELVTETVTTTQEQVVTVETLAPMVMSQTKDVTAKFISLTPQAMQLGLNDALLVGKLEYEKLPDNSTRTKIAWHSLAISTGKGSTLSEPLPPPLESQFLSNAEREEPGTQLAARGNLDIVTQKFLLLKEKAGKDKQPKTLVAEAAEKEEEKRDNKADELTPTSSKGAGGGGAAPSNSQPQDFNAALITTTWEPCAVRIAAAESRVYQQHRPVDKDETGAVVDSGGCVDTGVFYDAAKVYGGTCAVLPDYNNKKVYEQYREVATVEGKEVVVRECTTDFNKFAEIKATVTGKEVTCGYRHDFVGSRSIEQEILYYTSGKENIELTPCQDGAKAYTHFETELTCSYIIDPAKGLAFKQTRIGFNDASGGTSFATECRPITGDTGKAIQEEYCTPKYEHDFVNHVSYYRTRSFFLDSNNVPAYVTECGRSASNSFPHSFTTSSCSLVNNDTAMQTQYYALTRISTPNDGIIEIAPCAAYGSPVAYVRTTDKTATWEKTAAGSYTFTLPTTLASNTIVVNFAAGGGGGGGGGSNYYSGGGGGNGMSYSGYTIGGVAAGQSIPVTLGAGGNGGSGGWGAGGNGAAGGSSSFGGYITAAGGSGGGGGSLVAAGAGGAGNSYAGGRGIYGGSCLEAWPMISCAGTNGTSSPQFAGGISNTAVAYGGSGGGGGASLLAAGGAGGRGWYTYATAASAGSVGSKGSGGGGGGAGGDNNLAQAAAGGKGGDGYCKVTYYTPQYLRADGTTYAP